MTAAAELARVVAERARSRGLWVAAVESLTSGSISSALGAAPQAAEWFAGAITAYRTEVKHDLLGVSPGPVVSSRAAREMVRRGCQLLGATAGVAVTGAGGPAPQDGRPAGTVHIAVLSPAGVTVVERHFPGGPEQVVTATIHEALDLLGAALRH